METNEFILKGIEGYLWTKLLEIKSSDFIEPSFPVQKSDLILSHMTYLEKRVYTATIFFFFCFNFII